MTSVPDSSPKTTYIYALCEPGSVVATEELPVPECVRYVGKTVQQPTSRLANHIYACSFGRTPSAAWLRDCLAVGNRPVIAVLQIVPHDADWSAAEKCWIAHYRQVGADLLNMTIGGGHGTMSDDVRARMSASQRTRIERDGANVRNAAIRAAYQRPDVKKRFSEVMKVRAATSDFHDHLTRIARSSWDDPDIAKNHLIAIRAGMTSDVIARRNESIRRNAATPEFREKMRVINRENAARRKRKKENSTQ